MSSDQFTAEPTSPSETPTRVRHVVVLVCVVMATLLYLDRFCVSFAERYIKEDLELSDSQMAWFLSLFFLSYALAQVPAGWLSDRFGARGVLAFYILTWSFFTTMIGFAGGFLLLIVMQLGSGLAQAGAYPTSGGLLSKWVPFSRRGVASAFVALGGRIGGAIAPPLTAYLIVLFVPPTAAALLDEDQILNVPGLFAKLSPRVEPAGSLPDGGRGPEAIVSAERWASPAEHRVWSLLPADVQQMVRRIGIEFQQTHSGPDEASRQRLVAGLNAVLQQPDLFDEKAFSKLRKIEREALQLLNRRKEGSSLSQQETIRLNRLLLEAVFPAEIGKLYVRGWRPVFFTYGLSGLLVAAVFWVCFRNRPAEHPRCNAAERTLIESGRPATAPTASGTARGLPLNRLLRSRSLWLSSISQFFTNLAWLFFVTWLARYLMEVHEVPILERGWMASIPPLAGIAGMFLGGQLTDWLTRRMGLKWGRRLPMALTRFFAAGAYVACLWIDSPWLATAAFALGFFFVDLGVSAVWAFMQDVGGRHVGSILGWGNMWGNIGAFLAPHVYNAVLGSSPTVADWNVMFAVCAGMFTLSGIAALGIDATIPIAPPDEDAEKAGPPA